MRIALIGQAAFGEKVLEALAREGEEVVGVFCPPDVPGKPNPLVVRAQGMGVPVFQPKKMRDPLVYEQYTALKPDLNVMAFVTDIIPQSILDYPPLKTIQYHPSILPRHRGGSAINWAIINGETETGLSIFWPDQGIDSGEILLQKRVPIGPDDTTGSLYFNTLFPLGVEAMVEAVRMVHAGVAPHIPQDESLITYEPLCRESLTRIDWQRPVDQVYNLIRGASPQPAAWTVHAGKKLKIFDSRKQPIRYAANLGEVIALDENGIAVAAIGGTILIQRIQVEGEPKMKAADYAQKFNLKIGDKFDE